MAANPQYYNAPRNEPGVLSVANTNRDGTGTIVDIFTAGAAGSGVDSVTVQAIGNTTAGMVRIYVKTGATYRLYDEIPVALANPTASVPAFREKRQYNLIRPIMLESGQVLAASTHNAESFHVTMEGGDL